MNGLLIKDKEGFKIINETEYKNNKVTTETLVDKQSTDWLNKKHLNLNLSKAIPVEYFLHTEGDKTLAGVTKIAQIPASSLFYSGYEPVMDGNITTIRGEFYVSYRDNDNEENELTYIPLSKNDLSYYLRITDILIKLAPSPVKFIIQEEDGKNVAVIKKLISNSIHAPEDKIDIKHIGVPNICFSLTDNDDKREELFSSQRKLRGFDDSETWSLRDTIANFIIPRMERYNEILEEHVFTEVTEDASEKELRQDFLSAMKLIARNNGEAVFSEEERGKIEKGLNAFPKIFMRLWW